MFVESMSYKRIINADSYATNAELSNRSTPALTSLALSTYIVETRRVQALTIRLLFAGQNFNFMKHIIDRFKREPGYEVKTVISGMVTKITMRRKVGRCSEWQMSMVKNWLLGNAVWYSRNKQTGQLLITCYHRFEIDTP